MTYPGSYDTYAPMGHDAYLRAYYLKVIVIVIVIVKVKVIVIGYERLGGSERLAALLDYYYLYNHCYCYHYPIIISIVYSYR